MTLEEIPKILQGGNTPIKIINFDRLFNELRDHKRLRVFAAKGCKCVMCNVEGTIILKTSQIKGRGFHIDLYTSDFRLMTVDHIIPKSRGGSSSLDNLQPMCADCNYKKGNKI